MCRWLRLARVGQGIPLFKGEEMERPILVVVAAGWGSETLPDPADVGERQLLLVLTESP